VTAGDGSAQPDVRADSIARNAAFSLAIQLTGASLTAGLTLFLARALEPSGYGVFALAVATGSLLLLPSDLGISSSAARFIAERRGDTNAIAALLADALTLKLVVSGTVSAALILLAGPIADAYDEPSLVWPLRAVALALFGQSLMLFLSGSFVAQARVSASFRIDVSEALIEVSSSILYVLLGAGATGAAFGRATGYLAGAAIGAVVTARLVGRAALAVGRFRSGSARAVARYAGPLFLVDVAYAASGAVAPMVIGGVLGASAVGLFQAPARLVTFLHYPGYALANGVAPRMARHDVEGRRTDAFRAALRWLLRLYAALTVPFVVWSEPIVDLLLGDGYEKSADVMRALTPVIFLSGLAPLVSLAANYLGEAARRVPIAVTTVILDLVLTLVLVDRYGVVGAAVGSSVGFTFYVLGHVYVCRRVIDLPLAPLAATLARVALAAVVMGGVLRLLGGDDPSVIQWIAGPVAAVAAYLVVLLATRELTLGELRRALALVRRQLSGARS
jgi:O-antigen/teichoic acid export membrane protein